MTATLCLPARKLIAEADEVSGVVCARQLDLHSTAHQEDRLEALNCPMLELTEVFAWSFDLCGINGPRELFLRESN